jgi:hypothetical protein
VDGHLPAEQPGDRVDRLRGLGDAGERPDVRDARRQAVPALGLRADHRLVDTSTAAFEDLAVLVDEEVVADVVPAVVVAVVLGDAQDDSGRVLGRVVVGVDRVVHERHLDLAVAGRDARRESGPPLVARDHRGRAGGLRAAGADVPAPRSLRYGDELEAQRAPAASELELVGVADPDRVGAAVVLGVVRAVRARGA